MRYLIAVLAVLGVMLAGGFATPEVMAAGDSGYALALEQQPPSGQLDVDISTTEGGGGAWWASPIWIAVGVIALVLLVVIVAMASRGGGTTIVKE